MRKKIIHLLMGLPGSGKTSWAKSNIDNIIDCDDISHPSDIRDRIYWMLKWRNDADDCIDTLITTNKQLNTVMNIVSEVVRSPVKFIIHFWEENRELCLKNDEGRRKDSSRITIMNAPLEYPSPSNDFEYEIVEHKVFEKTFYDKHIAFVGEKGFLKSQRWSNGGTWGNCWGNTGTIDADDPKEFEELDNLLEKICPNISFLQYKKLCAACVTCESDYENDFYGGRENFSYWVCDLNKMYDMLKEMEVIKD